MSGTSSGGVFISYRREEAAPYARLLDYQVRERFPKARVFMDVDAIEPGSDFVEAIEKALNSCAVLLALVGRQWLTLTDEGGQRRLDDPDDYVRKEIQTALERGVRVIPVLVDEAQPPRQQQLPKPLAKLARLQAVELSHSSFQADADRILYALERALGSVTGEATGPAPTGDGAHEDSAPLPGRLGSQEPVQHGGAIPQVLIDRYEVGRLLAAGGVAEVYEGRDRLLGRRVAIKILHAMVARDLAFQETFQREARTAAMLSHPNIVGVYDTGVQDGTHFIVMEYVDGQNLNQVIQSEGPLRAGLAAKITMDVCSGLAAAHAHGLIHRDVKPGNVMVTSDGETKVMDFGFAMAVTSEIQTTSVIGTSHYISPEVAQGQAVDYRSDIYSVGCCLYQMLTGTVPFTGNTPVEIAYRHVREDPIPPRKLNPDVPAPLEAICLKAMAKPPDDRYQTAAELRTALEIAMQGLA
jgi:tRNA A-37 threonylcarbamoyl transferase component Bud32